jgi:hypothetical protein
MHTQRLATLALGGVLGSLGLPACDLDVPDLNDPGLDVLEVQPTAVSIGAACTGLLIGNRRNMAAANGYVSQLGILGRESYNFDPADPRYIGELLAGSLNQGSPFGGNFWAAPYANIRLANVILKALDKVGPDELSDPTKAGIRGFVNTITALDLLEVIVTHDTNGAVIDTDQPIVLPPEPQPLGAIVDKATTYAKITELLDGAVTQLDAADGFPFLFSSGYHNDSPELTFDTPARFRKFNRAIRARVATYLEDYPGALAALGESFLDDDPLATPMVPLDLNALNAGVFHVYSTKTGDATNALINPNIYAHPLLEKDAAREIDPMTNEMVVDARFTRKVTMADEPGSVTDTPLMSSLQFGGLYPGPDARVPAIRNEELILLKAEALFFTGNVEGAFTELDLVRKLSGGLSPLAGADRTSTVFIDKLLYERRYSLMFEGGHRWIDLRRFGIDLPLDDPTTHVRNVRYPIPLQECNARPDEPACELGSL